MKSPRHLFTSLMGRGCLAFLLLFFFLGTANVHAQTNGTINLNIGVNGVSGLGQPEEIDNGIKILVVMTLLTLAPSIILLMTCFTRIVIVLSFVRSALSLQGSPSNQIIIGLSLFLTFFIMSPVWERIDQEALTPYRAKLMSMGMMMMPPMTISLPLKILLFVLVDGWHLIVSSIVQSFGS